MRFFFKAALQKPLGNVFFAPLHLAVLFLAGSVLFSMAQTFGGSPPWGIEKPAHIQGEVQAGGSFEHRIGGGLSLYVLSLNDGFKIVIGRTETGASDDFTRCVTGPFHGRTPTEINISDFRDKEHSYGGIGKKRWFDYALSSENHEEQCRYLDCLLYPSNQDPECRHPNQPIGTPASGRGWLKITNVKFSDSRDGEEPSILSMTFEAECTLYGALQLWIRPATYIIPNDFVGWITVYHSEKGASKLPLANNRYTVRINKTAVVHTSSILRSDLRGIQFVSPNGEPLPVEQSKRGIHCYRNWSIGDSRGNHSMQSFFVGTDDEFSQSPQNPLLPSGGDCSD